VRMPARLWRRPSSLRCRPSPEGEPTPEARR